MTGPNALPQSLFRVFDRLVPAEDASVRPILLLAISGGADSTALLRAAVAWRDAGGASLAAAHFDHGLRGEDSRQDALFCLRLCEELDVPLHPGGPPAADQRPRSEDEARRLRYAFLESILDALDGPALCATGHHRDDQGETVLMRLFRGAGPHGLRGIRSRRERYIRPLLDVDGDELRRWLRSLDQPWREDASNVGDANLRARMRRELNPVLTDLFGEHALTAVARFSDLLAEDDDALNAAAATRLADLRRDDGEAVLLPRADLIAEPAAIANRMVRMVLEELATMSVTSEAKHLASFSEWARDGRSGSSFEFPGGLTVIREFEDLRFHRGASENPVPAYALTSRPATPAELAATDPEPGFAPEASRWRLTLPEGTICGEARLKPIEEGDRMTPFGMSGRKKISDLLRENRVPASRRASLLLVVDDLGPLWLVGLMREERTRLLPGTAKGITLLVEPRA